MHLSLQSAISLTHFTSISLILYSTNPHCIYPSSPLFVLPTLHLSLFSSILPTHYASFPLTFHSSNPLCIFPSHPPFFQPTMHLSLSSSVLQRLHFTSYIPTPSTQCAQRRPAEASGRSPAPRSTPCSFVSTRLL
jgi:hypothetical protein